MVARTEARQPEQLAIVDPIWGSLLNEARSAAAQDRSFRFSLFDDPQSPLARGVCDLPYLRTPRSSRYAGRASAPDLQDMLDDCRNGAVCCASTFRPFTTVTRPARASWSRSSISRVFRRSIPIGLPTAAAEGRRDLALYLQSRFIQHLPDGYQPGRAHRQGHLLDHATGLVVGETAVIGDNVSILHGVTLVAPARKGRTAIPRLEMA